MSSPLNLYNFFKRKRSETSSTGSPSPGKEHSKKKVKEGELLSGIENETDSILEEESDISLTEMAGKQQSENLSQLEDLVLGKIMDTIEQKLDSQFKRIREETKEQMTEMFSKMINSLTALERKVNSVETENTKAGN